MATAKKKQPRKVAPIGATPVAPISQIRVRAVKTGFAGDLLRNPGEVFLLDTRFMEKAPTAEEVKAFDDDEKDRLEKYETVEVDGIEYLLPTWVELVEDGDASVSEPAGHQTPTRDVL